MAAAADSQQTSESAETLRKVLLSVIDDPLFQLGSPEMNSAVDIAKSIADMSHSKSFQDFASMLILSLKRALVLPASVKCFTTRRERVWSNLHQKQTMELPLLWSSLFRELNMSHKADGAVLLTRHINHNLFDSMLMEEARCNSKDRSLSQASLASSETNALCYAAGYVPFALKKKLKHRPEFVTCLEQLEVKGEGDSYLAYTTEWIDSVNYSGSMTKPFIELEKKVGAYLCDVFASASGQTDSSKVEAKSEIIENIVEDTDVHFSRLLLYV